MYHFCTITTADHLYKTMALYDSLIAISSEIWLHVLCIDGTFTAEGQQHITYYSPDVLSEIPSAQEIITKYTSSHNKLRWCLKPVFLRYLTGEKAEKAIYVDNDIYFYGDFRFLFDHLDQYNFLLTPHNYPRDPGRNQNWLEANFKVGLYNAGFIGVNKTAAESLSWWAACCAYRCEKNPLRGTFDDQKYLDLIPVINEQAFIVRHRGCNVAEWNKDIIPRSEQNGQVMLDQIYPLIFVHYNGTTVRAILEGKEPFLKNSFEQYFFVLKKYKPDIITSSLMNQPSTLDSLKYTIWKVATKLGF